MKKYPYKDAKLRPEDHELLRTLSYHLRETYAGILGRLIQQEAKRLGLAEKAAVQPERKET